MAFSLKTWTDRLSEFATRRILTDQDTGTVSVVEVARSEGTIYQQGDAFSAANMNELEGRVDAEFNMHLNPLTATITAGNTTATITNSIIHTTSLIDVYFEDMILAPSSIEVTEGQIDLEIPAQADDVTVGVIVLNPHTT